MAQLPTRPRMRANQHKPAPELGWGRNYDFALRVAPAVRRMGWVEVGVGRRWSGRRCVDLGSRRLRQSERTLGYVRIREPPRAPGGLLGNAEPTSSSLTMTSSGKRHVPAHVHLRRPPADEKPLPAPLRLKRDHKPGFGAFAAAVLSFNGGRRSL